MKRIAIFGLLIGVVASCAPDPARDLTAEETDLIITRKSETHDYSQDMLYAIFDQVIELEDDTIKLSDTDLDRSIIDQIRANMADYGYTESLDSLGNPDTTDPNLDIVLLVAKFTQTEGAAAVQGGYWQGYPGYWNPWYQGYPGSGWYNPGYTALYQYESGSVIIDMFDWAKRNEEILFPIWEGGLRGILTGNAESGNSRVLNAVDQAFRQSPYLNKNQ